MSFVGGLSVFQQVLGYYAWGFYQVHKCPSNKSGETNSAWHVEEIGLCNFCDRFIISWDHFPGFHCNLFVNKTKAFTEVHPPTAMNSAPVKLVIWQMPACHAIALNECNFMIFLLSALVRYVMCVSYCNSMDHFDGYPTSHGIAVLIMRNKTHLKPRTGHLAAVGSIIPSKNSPK